MKRQIWTYGYFPFQMGGNVNRVIITEVDMVEEKSIGKGIKAFSFKTPMGSVRIAESITGAIVGDSWEEVIADVKAASKAVMNQQIKEAKEAVSNCPKHMTNEKFFSLFKY